MESENIRINEQLKGMRGETIKELVVDTGTDQYLILTTDKSELRLGANGLGVWIERLERVRP